MGDYRKSLEGGEEMSWEFDITELEDLRDSVLECKKNHGPYGCCEQYGCGTVGMLLDCIDSFHDQSKPQLTWQRGPIPADGLYVTTWPDDTVDAAYYERGDQPFFDAKHSAWCGPLVVIYRKERG